MGGSRKWRKPKINGGSAAHFKPGYYPTMCWLGFFVREVSSYLVYNNNVMGVEMRLILLSSSRRRHTSFVPSIPVPFEVRPIVCFATSFFSPFAVLDFYSSSRRHTMVGSLMLSAGSMVR